MDSYSKANTEFKVNENINDLSDVKISLDNNPPLRYIKNNKSYKAAKQMAIASLVLSIISWILYLTFFPAIVFALASWILGKKSRKIIKLKRTLAGLILSGILLGSYSLILIFISITIFLL